ncbi:thiol:disulfide interchange protein DsbA/DsbL [Piscinibacter sakaiensis]|uniref:Thiol:disulfide interchange protein n=1 Tax=Piscinibacter sakaiensis TaxID=1547922 RepID=A0A0K8P7J2_PISS1|nr:thiol:disulfide interchange protein DsbA/DsbL [Piscinibacter sakaiensis]GAP38597.1 periplasmic thiol:disulfide interchange protein DsbA [Piscinibacter sakaiensis]
MNRREFSATVLGAGLGAASLGLPAHAQGGPVEGRDYVKLSQPLPVPPGKIEVIEFFWYGCPHCNAFEPTLEGWVKKVPSDVAFRRVPVAFRDEPFVAHQKIFYALEAMGQLDAMHRKVFYAIHVDRQRLDKPADIAAFMAKNGVDAAKFTEQYNSFSVQTKTSQAKRLAESYRIDGVPALGVHGRFYTSSSLTGSAERALSVTDFLIQTVRKG